MQLKVSKTLKQKGLITYQTYTNYQKADWNNFTKFIERKLIIFDTSHYRSLNHALTYFTKAVHKASNIHIPKGHKKHYNPNFSPQIDNLIKQLNTLRQNRRPTREQIDHIRNLNNEVNTLISEKQKK